jgi:N-methylhydantoinase A
MNSQTTTLRIAADVRGTFTDVLLRDAQGRLWVHKVLSTPPDFEQAGLQAVAHLLCSTGVAGVDIAGVAHATTVATNAVLEHRGAKTALITTRGFRDVLELRRLRAPQMYDLFFEKPAPLVERHLRVELNERVSADGEVLTPVQHEEVQQLAWQLQDEQVEAVAVCLLHSYAFGRHEEIVGALLREHGQRVPISLSSEVLPERKEYERTATNVVNAYLRPVMERYLKAVREGLHALDIKAPLLIMQSAGGLAPEEEAKVRPVYARSPGRRLVSWRPGLSPSVWGCRMSSLSMSVAQRRRPR